MVYFRNNFRGVDSYSGWLYNSPVCFFKLVYISHSIFYMYNVILRCGYGVFSRANIQERDQMALFIFTSKCNLE